MITRIPARYKNASLDNFQTPTDEHKRLLEYVREWLKKPDDRNVMITGGVGTGKTYLAYAMVREFSEFCQSREKPEICWWSSDRIMLVSLKSMIDDVKRSFSSGENNLDSKLTAPILIVDEIGLQYGSDMERIELFELFDKRYANMLPTICLSNLTTDQVKRVVGLRITDRLLAGAMVFNLKSESMRKAA